MKTFLLICLVSSLASSEKLDRSYLPPPGSKFSGGTLGDTDVPLEFPKQPTGRPQPDNGRPEIELGINRRPAPTGTPDSQKPGFTYFQNSYPVPKTTTSYAITQTTTFPADQPNGFVNGSNVQQGVPGQKYQQSIRRPGQEPNYNQYRPGQSQSTVTPFGTTVRPPFPNNFNGLEYLPPVSKKPSPNQAVSSQGDFSYTSNLPQGPNYQNGEALAGKQPGYTPGPDQQKLIGNQNLPSTVAPQYHDERFGPMGPGSHLIQNQFPGGQFPSSTNAPQYQTGQRYNPGTNQQNLDLGNQDLPSSTAAPQYQGGQRLSTPGSNQKNSLFENEGFPSSTTAPQFQTPGSNQQVFGARIPSQPNQYIGNQFPSSTIAPTPGSIQRNQYPGNQNYPSTAVPNYRDGQRFTTPDQIQGPGQQPFGSRVASQNQYPGQTLPSSTIAPQFQDGERLNTPDFVEGYRSSKPKQPLQYPGSQDIPSSTLVPEYQTGQQFTTGLGTQNLPSTAVPNYQNGNYFTAPGHQKQQLVPGQQFRPTGQQGQNEILGNQNYPSSTVAPQYQDIQRYSTPGSQQGYETPQQNQYGDQNFPTLTAAPQYQDQRFSTPGQLFNQPPYPGSTAAPQYQQTHAPTSGTNQPISGQQSPFQRPTYNQQIPSMTGGPQRLIPGSQAQFGNNNIPTSGTVFPQQGLPGIQSNGNNQQPTLQPEAGSSIYGTAPSFSNQRYPSTTVGSIPSRDFSSTPGFGAVSERRPERPQTKDDRNAEILNYENVLTPEGYFYTYDTSNGIHADETGEVGNGTRAQGGYSYTGDDGKMYSVIYTADENGFQPRGDHLPTPPPIPEAIQRIIDQANKEKEAGIDDDGSYNEEKYGYMKYEGPLTRLRPRNRTVSIFNGADIPERTEDSVFGRNKNLLKPKGRRPGLQTENAQEYETEETDIIDKDFEEMDGNRRINGKRPKPIEVADRGQIKGTKTAKKPVAGSKKKGSNRLQISTEEYDDTVPTNDSEELEDNDDLQDLDNYDVDSDLVNYSDNPSNRTDFHGLNKYLPESKKTHRKKQPSKNRPSVRVDGVIKPVTGVSETTGDRFSEESQDTKPDFVDESRTRIPSRKNKYGQVVKGPSKITDQNVPLESVDENNAEYDEQSDINEEYDSGDATKPISNIRKNKITTPGSKNKLSGTPKRPTYEQNGVSLNNKNEPSSNQETGYEYTPPQRKFGSEEMSQFPSRTNQKGIQTTVRPFLTKNVYGDENEPTDEYIDQYGNVKPVRPIAGQKYPSYNQRAESYDQNTNINDNESFPTTRRPSSFGTSRRPFGRPQTAVTPQYQDQGVTVPEGESYQGNPEVNQNQGFPSTRRPFGTSQRPFGRPQSTTSPYDQGLGVTSPEGDSYSQNNPVDQSQGFSTTRRPSYGTSQRPFGTQSSAPRYQDQVTGQVYVSNHGPQKPGDKLLYNTNAPDRGAVANVFSSTTPAPPSGPDSTYQRPVQYQNRPTDGSVYEATSPDGETYIRPGQVPSTTYRPNYGFGDKISSVTVDGSGRPIQSTAAPVYDRTLRPTNPEINGPNQQLDGFRPNEGRFGVTSGPETPEYQSTSAPIGEDFSGPKQPQRFDPNNGYHYK